LEPLRRLIGLECLDLVLEGIPFHLHVGRDTRVARVPLLDRPSLHGYLLLISRRLIARRLARRALAGDRIPGEATAILTNPRPPPPAAAPELSGRAGALSCAARGAGAARTGCAAAPRG